MSQTTPAAYVANGHANMFDVMVATARHPTDLVPSVDLRHGVEVEFRPDPKNPESHIREKNCAYMRSGKAVYQSTLHD